MPWNCGSGDMNTEKEQNFGEQPINQIMQSHNLTAKELVSASTTAYL